MLGGLGATHGRQSPGHVDTQMGLQAGAEGHLLDSYYEVGVESPLDGVGAPWGHESPSGRPRPMAGHLPFCSVPTGRGRFVLHVCCGPAHVWHSCDLAGGGKSGPGENGRGKAS